MDVNTPAGMRAVDDDADLLEPQTGLLTASGDAVSVAAFTFTCRGVSVLFKLSAEAA